HEPIQIDNQEIITSLSNIADYFLLHNRQIYQRADDSVIKPMYLTSKFMKKNIEVFLRKSRGFVPDPIECPLWYNDSAIVAVSSELHTTGAVATKGKIFITQYIGDLKYEKTLNFLSESLNNLITILQKPEITEIIGDMHPSYISTELGKELSRKFKTPFVQIQHHKAHAASLLGENKLFYEKSVIFVSDGLGFGEDGNIWGGEFFYGNIGNFVRENHWEYYLQPGGDLATKYPIRIVISFLLDLGYNKEKLIDLIQKRKINIYNKQEIELIIDQCEKKINAPYTSSTGRFLDAISTLLNLVSVANYEGEPAITLESYAMEWIHDNDFSKENRLLELFLQEHTDRLSLKKLFKNVLILLEEKLDPRQIAYFVLDSIGHLAALETIRISEEKGNIQYIGITGGVAYNDIITSRFCKEVKIKSYIPVLHKLLPPGDGCISVGQCFQFIGEKLNIESG
ncbi:MAG: carbamoyltransferase HypF, partial [Candidatus Thorarchaeota archaeon]